MSWRKAAFGGLFFLSLMASKSVAADDEQFCQGVTVDSDRFTVCKFSAADADIRLFWGEGKTPYRNFETLSKALEAQKKRLVFAMNAGSITLTDRPWAFTSMSRGHVENYKHCLLYTSPSPRD